MSANDSISKPSTSRIPYADLRRIQVGRNVRLFRSLRRETQQSLADLLGCSRKRVADVEHGKAEFRLGELEQIAEAWGMSLSRLISPNLVIE